MSKYLEGVTTWFQGIADNVAAEANPHRKAILANYLAHAALEYTDRWEEIFDPARTVAHPVYRVHMGTPDEVLYDGADAVKGFYRSMKDDTFLTNQDQYLAVNDWGFASFLTINLFMDAAKARSLGYAVDGAARQYILKTLCAMYWTYDSEAKLLGEYVYEISPGTMEAVEPQDEITFEDVQKVVANYLPPLPESRVA